MHAGADLTAAGWSKMLACVAAAAAPEAVAALRLGLPYGVARGDDARLAGAPAILSALDCACMRLRGLRLLNLSGLLVAAHQLPLLAGALHTVSGSLEELRVWDDAWWDGELARKVRAHACAACGGASWDGCLMCVCVRHVPRLTLTQDAVRRLQVHCRV